MKIQPENLCMGCMEPTSGDVCSLCGWSEQNYSASPLHLRIGTTLDGRYLLGRVLGAGGFGVTYLGWDLNLGMKLAIKEYFPSAFGTRDLNRSSVIPSASQNRQFFEQGLARFLEEGQALARFQGNPGIASVLTFFRENGTSYLVMKYEDGITLKEYLRQQGGRLDYQRARQIAMHVMDALRTVHGAGILHRDISPDNIYLNSNGQIKILDFGSAKHDLANQNPSTQITLKRGYSPEEQYRSNGKVGPWTDVYAMGATLYQAVTGQVPPESLDRLADDQLQPPSALDIGIPEKASEAIMRALAVRAADRFQTMQEFQDALTAAGESSARPAAGGRDPSSAPTKVTEAPVLVKTEPRKTARWLIPLAAALVLMAAAGIAWRIYQGHQPTPGFSSPTPPEPTPPSVTNAGTAPANPGVDKQPEKKTSPGGPVTFFVRLVTTPDDADLIVDDRKSPCDKHPCGITLARGSHRALVSKPGYSPLSTSFEVESELQEIPLDALKPLPPPPPQTAELILATEPKDVTVTITGGTYDGTPHPLHSPYTLEVGKTYHIVLAKEGYEDFPIPVEVKDTSMLTQRVSLAKKP